MSVTISGMDELQRELERRFGQGQMMVISDAALLAGAEVFKQELISQMRTFKDTGASIDEISLTSPYSKNGVRTITVHWKGPKGRYRVIHLNEFGTVKNPNPRGKGAIARALRNSEAVYRSTIESVLRGAL